MEYNNDAEKQAFELLGEAVGYIFKNINCNDYENAINIAINMLVKLREEKNK